MSEVFPWCKCERSELRQRRQANGAAYVGRQCLNCGKSVGRASVKSVRMETLPWWDDSIREAYQKKIDEFHKRQMAKFEADKNAKDVAFWAKHAAHMRSAEWQILRHKVFTRSKGMCEGCAERRAVQVHHLTYERLGEEMLFDLAAICLTCHEKIHGRPIV